MGFFGQDCHVTHKKWRFRHTALNKIKRQLQNACSPDEVKRKPGTGLSVIYEQHFICVKSRKKGTNLSAPNIRFQQAFG